LDLLREQNHEHNFNVILIIKLDLSYHTYNTLKWLTVTDRDEGYLIFDEKLTDNHQNQSWKNYSSKDLYESFVLILIVFIYINPYYLYKSFLAPHSNFLQLAPRFKKVVLHFTFFGS